MPITEVRKVERSQPILGLVIGLPLSIGLWALLGAVALLAS